MADIKLNLPSDSSISDPQIRQEVTQIKEQIRVLVSALNSLLSRVDKIEGSSNGN